MAKRNIIEFHYDISCPFAYIASTRIEGLAARTDATLIWRPVLLGAIYRATNAPQGAAGSASDVFNPTKKAVTSRAFQRTIQRYGIPYNEPPRHPVKTTAPLRLLYYIKERYRPALTKALFRAYWVEGKDVSDKSTLRDLVQSLDIDISSQEQHAIIEAIDNGDFEQSEPRSMLERATDDAVQRGSPGVPAFWLPDEAWTDGKGNKRQGRLYWGQDRMHFVESVLEALNAGKKQQNSQALSEISKPLQQLIPRCVSNKAITSNEEVKLEFWYDFSSPWAFLGWTQLARLKRQFGDRLHIDMKPFLLGILFREIGAPNLPMAAISEQKRQYSQQDHRDWVRWLNAVNLQEGKPDKNIDFKWAEKFPIRTPTVLRAVLVEPRLVDVLFRACWERNLDMSSDHILRDTITEAGYNGNNILTRANEADIKAELRTRTKEAKDVGICGVPSYRVLRRKAGQGEQDWQLFGDIVWGQDELAVVEDLTAGWSGEATADVGKEVKTRSRSKL